MEIFKLVEQILDELYAQISGSETAKAAAANGKLAMLTRRYTDLKREADPIDYSEPATRFPIEGGNVGFVAGRYNHLRHPF